MAKINSNVEIVAFVIATKDILNFNSAEWTEDYEGIKFNIKKASILAYQNLNSLKIDKESEQCANVQSIFSIYKNITTSSEPFKVEMENSKIRIGLSSDDYNNYCRYSKQPQMRSVLNSMIILPTLVYIFETLKIQTNDNELEIDTYKDKLWFKSLQAQYAKKDIDLINELINTDKKSITLAQETMDLPISKALLDIQSLYEINEEDEE